MHLLSTERSHHITTKIAVLRLERKSVAELEWNPANPRVRLTPDMPFFADLKRSIEENGYLDPLIWNKRTGHLLAGNQRLIVLEALGYQEVDVSVVDIPEERESRILILLNKLMGEWEYDSLGSSLRAMEDTSGLGFPDWELRTIEDDELRFSREVGEDEYKGMPQYEHDDLSAFRTIRVHFEDEAAVISFAELMGQQITPLTKILWHPRHKRQLSTSEYTDDDGAEH